jgi:hypothetical protein
VKNNCDSGCKLEKKIKIKIKITKQFVSKKSQAATSKYAITTSN